jgi:CBS domain-containing membrane protein
MQARARTKRAPPRPVREARRSPTAHARVRDIMSSPVEFLEMGDSLDLAQHLMKAGRIRHLPVVDGQQRLIGLVTHRKLLAAWVGHGDPAHERPREIAREIPVDMLMETRVFTTTPETPAAEAARIIEEEKIGCLPVVEGGKLVGIVTEADFVRLARKLLGRSDA